MCTDMYIDMCRDMCIDMCTDIHLDICRNTCIDMLLVTSAPAAVGCEHELTHMSIHMSIHMSVHMSIHASTHMLAHTLCRHMSVRTKALAQLIGRLGSSHSPCSRLCFGHKSTPHVHAHIPMHMWHVQTAYGQRA